MTKTWGMTSGRRGGSHILLPLVAMLVSGCFHVGPSAKQAMTSAAPGGGMPPAAHATGPGTKAPADATFDLDNPAVQSRVAAFQTHQRGFFGGALSRGAKYLPSMTDILVRQGLPAELAYLPLIESGYRTLAVSPAGAAGPWQFIPETGRRYGLRIDALVDERRDPIKSTHAASLYLKDLHEMFGDWELSLAAYNSGEYRIARILANKKDVEDFWDMRERGYLPIETSAYVPKFLAAVQIARAPEDYGFSIPTHTPEHYETVDVDRQVSVRAAANLCGVSATELAEMNPALRSGVTPSGYSLRVPAGKAEPLRIGLATYVEPVHARRNVARSTRGGRSGRGIARSTPAGRGVVGVAQGKKSAVQVARTAPQIRVRRPGKATVQTARTGSAPTREAKVSLTPSAAPVKKAGGSARKAAPNAKAQKAPPRRARRG
jgi:membrane-bound lytic murein transglycosylase D